MISYRNAEPSLKWVGKTSFVLTVLVALLCALRATNYKSNVTDIANYIATSKINLLVNNMISFKFTFLVGQKYLNAVAKKQMIINKAVSGKLSDLML